MAPKLQHKKGVNYTLWKFFPFMLSSTLGITLINKYLLRTCQLLGINVGAEDVPCRKTSLLQ